MRALVLTEPNPRDPVSAIQIVDRPEPEPRDDWAIVTVRTASVNHHDVWSLRGAVDRSWLPLVLGSDGAGVDEDGNEVILYPVVADAAKGGGDETLDLSGAMLSTGMDGTFAERVAIPRRNLIPKPAGMSWETAGSLGTAWLTAYRMLFTAGDLKPGSTVLVQGAGGGLATAAIALGSAAGLSVHVTGGDPEKLRRAKELGADAVYERGARIAEKVDVVIDSVGEATWEHSLKSVRPGGKIVVSGATTGPNPPANLLQVFLPQISIVGATMGTRRDFERLIRLCDTKGIAPTIDSTWSLEDAAQGIRRMVDGELFGKVVLRPTEA